MPKLNFKHALLRVFLALVVFVCGVSLVFADAVSDAQKALDNAKASLVSAERVVEIRKTEFKEAQTSGDNAEAARSKYEAALAKKQEVNASVAEAEANLATAKAEAQAKADSEKAVSAYEKSDAQKLREAELESLNEDFEVTLQTPFVEPPDSGCDNPSENDYMSKNGYLFVCQKGATKWQQVIRANNGSDFLMYYGQLLYKWLAGFIGIVSVLMIVFGGIQITTAGANQEGLQKGKDRIIAALAGLTLLLLSSLILYTINPTFFTL